MKTLELTLDEAYNIAYGSPDSNERKFETKIVDLVREKYHMRQLVLIQQSDEWFGFEFFDALDKHGESEIGETYVNDDTVTAYEVKETQTVSYDYEFVEKEEESY